MEPETHKFERKKIGKGVKCLVCNSLIWSNGYACSLCEIPAHKACAVKARKDPCDRRITEGMESITKLSAMGKNNNNKGSSDSIVRQEVGSPLSFSGNNIGSSTNLEIFFSDGSCKTINYHPDAILLQILSQLREEKELEGSYMIYDRAGKVITNYDQTLKKLKTVFPIFYTVVDGTVRGTGKKNKGLVQKKNRK